MSQGEKIKEKKGVRVCLSVVAHFTDVFPVFLLFFLFSSHTHSEVSFESATGVRLSLLSSFPHMCIHIERKKRALLRDVEMFFGDDDMNESFSFSSFSISACLKLLQQGQKKKNECKGEIVEVFLGSLREKEERAGKRLGELL